MSKNLTANMLTHLAGEIMTLCTCWKITRRDTTVLRFTDHDQDVDVPADGLYEASSGFSGSGIASNAQLSVDEMEVQALLDSAAIKEVDLIAGLYDYAQVEIFLVNFRATADGKIQIRKGWMGEIRLGSNGVFFTEVRGMMQVLQSTYGEVLTPTCRADLGDARCKVDIGALTFTGNTVATVVTDLFKITSTQIDGQAKNHFQYGQLTWTIGDNAGFVNDVKFSENSTLELFNPTPFSITVGDAFDVYPGCDKRIQTCKAKFDNVPNFRGEPNLPGQDKVVQHAQSR